MLDSGDAKVPVLCALGYSDFHNLIGFTGKRWQIILKLFGKKAFQLKLLNPIHKERLQIV